MKPKGMNRLGINEESNRLINANLKVTTDGCVYVCSN